MNKLKQFDYSFHDKGIEYLCGIDEAGRGSLAGPVVAGAVVFRPEVFIEGVKDSKKLTPIKRDMLFYEIVLKAESWSVGIINSGVIDKVNILEATKLAMLQAIDHLERKPQFCLIDGVKWKEFPVDHQTVIKGDNTSFSIAAASIIAKVIRDRIMDKISIVVPQFKLSENKGYGTREHIVALSKHEPSSFHRMSFRPVYQPELIF